MNKKQERLRILLFEEGDTWAAQCLEYDIAAQGVTQEEAAQRLAVTIAAELELRTGDLSDIPPPPENLIRLYQQGHSPTNTLARQVRDWGKSLMGPGPEQVAPEWRVA